ncbi:glycosyltransferase family 87 protein [Blastomonas sp.]|uniref:glycosyltransferase family 87 protein n=1 Tax=Blastomonas sp. TaxID=1909299 RepID=UPI00391BED42
MADADVHTPRYSASDSDPSSPAVADSLFTRTRLAIAILIVLAVLGCISAINFQAPQMLGAQKVLTDYDAFHIAGLLALDGRADEAYRIETMITAQREFSGTRWFMPWTYPPPFTLFVAALALLPIGLGFALFVSLSLALYLIVLRRIAGVYLPGVLIVMLPTLLLMMRTGQNGFLTGGLIGLFLLAFLQRQAGAGWPLGLMIIKPHLAVAVALMTVGERRWPVVLRAGAVVVIALLVPTLVFGPTIWEAFLDGVAQSASFLREGYYPLFRMTSLYAAAFTLGAGAQLAMGIQAAGALAAIAALVLLRRAAIAPHRMAAAVCCATVFISPYNYDYDLTIIGLAVAFVLRDVLQRSSKFEQAALVAAVWAGTGYGLFCSIVRDGDGGPQMAGAADLSGPELSLMGPILLLIIAAVVRILARAPRTELQTGQRHPA